MRIKRRSSTEFVQYAIILCPGGALEKDPENREEIMGKRYVYAQIFGPVMADVYNLAMEAKIVIAVEDIEAEVSGIGCPNLVLVYNDLEDRGERRSQDLSIGKGLSREADKYLL